MTSPAPLYQADLVLVGQEIQHPLADHDLFITYACDFGSYAGTIAACVADLKDAFADAWTARLDSQAFIGQCHAKFGVGTSTPLQAVTASAAIAGTRVVSSMPPNSNLLISKKTAFAGRTNRGRLYMPYFVGTGDVDEGGNIIGGLTATCQTQADLWLSDMNARGIPMMICNRTLAANPTPPPAEYVNNYNLGNPVTALVVDNLIASQRRRIGR